MTDQELKDLIAQNAMSINKLSEKIDRISDDISRLEKSQAETDRKMQESSDKFDAKRDKIMSKFEDIWFVQWEFAEDSIRRSIKEDLAVFGIDIYKIESNMEWHKDGLEWEYDLVAINDKEIVVVEVKNKMNRQYLKRFVNIQLPRFKMFFPEYQNFTLYGGIGALIFDEKLEKEAEELWLFTFTQNGKNIRLNNKKSFRPKVY